MLPRAAALAALLLTAQAAPPGLRDAMLTVHNAERAAVGAPPLAWSAALAADAEVHAQAMARSGKFAHATNLAALKQGENLWMGTSGYSYAEMAEAWAAEKRYFVNRPTPDFSTTGNWRDVGHYTQMVWHKSAMIGCALAPAPRSQIQGRFVSWYLVCRYSPPGNFVGERAIPPFEERR
jgi:uncharacterized protein YkwD